MFRLFRKEEKPFFDDFKGFKKKYTDEDFFNNRILTEEVSLSLNRRKTLKNNNVFILSDVKDRNDYIKANILQLNSNYVIPDFGGEIYDSVHYFLENNGYNIQVLNLIDMSKSIHYNPFEYLKTPKDVYDMLDVLLDSTDYVVCPDNTFSKTEHFLMAALFFYVVENMPKEQHNFNSVFDVLEKFYIKEEDTLKETNELFEVLDESSLAYKYYHEFKKENNKYLRGIIVSASIRLQIFRLNIIQEMMSENTVDFEALRKEKQAIFIIMPFADTSFSPISDIFYSQLIDSLYKDDKAFETPIFVVCNGYLINLARKLSTCNKYNIHFSVCYHSLAELKKYYEHDWEVIIGNCDSFLFMGSNKFDDWSFISKMLGVMPIKTTKRISKRKFKHIDPYKREIMTVEELHKMPDNKCLLFIRCFKPMYCNKYNIENHPNYSLLRKELNMLVFPEGGKKSIKNLKNNE